MSSRSRIASYLRDDFRFDRAPGVVEWAEGVPIILPHSMSPRQPGPFSIRRRPMMRSVLECWHPNSGVRKCTITAGSQFAKTTIGIIGSSYRLVHSPGPMLIAGKSEDWLKVEISEKRFQAVIDENPVLSALKPYDGSRYRKMNMEMSGGIVSLEGTDSNIATAGSTQMIVWICEAAKVEHRDSEEAPEAHPIKLLWERTKDFAGLDFHFMDFTPNTEHHLAWKEYLAGDQTHFYVPCPRCKEYFTMEFECRQKGEDEELEQVLEQSQEEANPDYYRSLVWSPDARMENGLWNEDRIIETARYICPINGCEIRDADKDSMMQAYEEKRHNPGASRANRSFRATSFYSPRVRFGDMAWQFLQRGDLFTSGLQNFYNSWLAKPWAHLAHNIKEEHVMKCRLEYARRTYPTKPALALLTCDPGEVNHHWMVVGIGIHGELYAIDWGVIIDLNELLNPEFLRARCYYLAGTNDKIVPQVGYIDSGYDTEKVYSICEDSHGVFWPTKGSDVATGTWVETRAASRPDLKLYAYSDTQLKDEQYGRRIHKRKGPPIFIPWDSDSDLILGMSGQQKDRQTGKWKKLPNDHLGDTMKLGLLGSQIGRTVLKLMRDMAMKQGALKPPAWQKQRTPEPETEAKPASVPGRDYVLKPPPSSATD